MTDKFQILSLDGGGIKGLFSAAVLAAVEDDLNVNIVDHFDLIVGTSTGGIIALGLGLGLRPKEIVDFYLEKGPSIFHNPMRIRSLQGLLFRKFPQKPLRKALKSPEIFGEKLLGDSRKRLVLPSYNLGKDDVYIFKTPHHERLKRDWRVPAWKVALATTAAPTFFPACRHIDYLRLIDGGMWANNPTMLGIVEAMSVLEVPLVKIQVLSLGTSVPVVNRPRFLDWGGGFIWAKQAADVFMRGQALGASKQAFLLLGPKKLLRLDPEVPSGLFTLDGEHRKDQLMGLASHESRIIAPKLKEVFIPHFANPYQPLYPVEKEN